VLLDFFPTDHLAGVGDQEEQDAVRLGLQLDRNTAFVNRPGGWVKFEQAKVNPGRSWACGRRHAETAPKHSADYSNRTPSLRVDQELFFSRVSH